MKRKPKLYGKSSRSSRLRRKDRVQSIDWRSLLGPGPELAAVHIVHPSRLHHYPS